MKLFKFGRLSVFLYKDMQWDIIKPRWAINPYCYVVNMGFLTLEFVI